MKNQISLNIKTPCSKNFGQFTPTSNGGFCDSCEKEVIDFTSMSTEETINYFKNKKTENTCGRFNSNQLNSNNHQFQKNKKMSFVSGMGLACLSLFSIFTTQAQDIKKQNEASNGQSSNIINTKKDQAIVIKGTLFDENGFPLPGAHVILEGTTIGIATDFDGNFTFPQKLKKGDVLIFSYVGYESTKVVIDTNNFSSKIELLVNMKSDNLILMGKVAVKQVYKSNRK